MSKEGNFSPRSDEIGQSPEFAEANRLMQIKLRVKNKGLPWTRENENKLNIAIIAMVEKYPDFFKVAESVVGGGDGIF